MNKSPHGLAWRMYPEPDGTDYTADDLRDEKTVEMIFDYCQILEAAIFAEGWRLLFKTFGMDGLIRINKRSGWFNESDDALATDLFMYYTWISGYDPIEDTFGTYDENTGVFTPREQGL